MDDVELCDSDSKFRVAIPECNWVEPAILHHQDVAVKVMRAGSVKSPVWSKVASHAMFQTMHMLIGRYVMGELATLVLLNEAVFELNY